MPPLQVVPVTLVGRVVQLEPLRLDHAPALWPQVAPGTFAYFPSPPDDDSLPAFEEFVRRIIERPAWSPFATVLREAPSGPGQPIGMTCYLDIRPADRGLEIGSTWI